MNCVRAAEGSAMKLLELICENFESFRDEYEWPQEPRVRVRFLKRAQILVADVWSCFSSFPQMQSPQFEELRALTAFVDVRELTCFADYRVPQALAFFGVLRYSSGLLERLRARTHRLRVQCSSTRVHLISCAAAVERIAAGSREELELRGCTIAAIEQLCDALNAALNAADSEAPLEGSGSQPPATVSVSVSPAQLDYYLWRYRREHAEAIERAVPFHRTRTIFY